MPVTVPVTYETDGSGLERDLTKDTSAAGSKAGKGFAKSFLAPVAALVSVRAIGGFLKDSIAEARESEKVNARTANVIKTTGGVANVTAKQIGNLSTAIARKTGIDDETIQTGSNLLLTFKNIRNEAGKGADVFNRATRAAVDLSASGFGDINGASKQLGKALNDPIKGISALGKAGVTFSEDQKKTIKSFVDTGNILGAQKIILKEVESQVKGSAAAQATAADKAKFAFGELKEQIGTALLPTIDKLENFATSKLIPAVSKLVTEFQNGTGAGGQIRDQFEQIVGVGAGVIHLFASLPGPVKKFGIEALIAYVVLGKLSTGLVGAGVRVTAFGTAALTAGARTAALRSGALFAAAGLAALSQATAKTNPGLSTMSAGLAGAAAGAFIGSGIFPGLGTAIGAVGGAAIGAAIGLHQAGKAAVDAGNDAATSAAKWDAYTDSLNQNNAAATKETRKRIAANIKANASLFTGFNPKVILNAVLGRANAEAQVTRQQNKQYNNAVRANTVAQNAYTIAQANLDARLKAGTIASDEARAVRAQIEPLKTAADLARTRLDTAQETRRKQVEFIDGLRNEQSALRANVAEALTFKDLIKLGVPKNAARFIDRKGVGQYAADVARVIDQFHVLDETKWNPIIRSAGLVPSKALTEQIRGILHDIDAARVHPKVDGSGIKNAEGHARNLLDILHSIPNATGSIGFGNPKKKALGGPVRAGEPYIVGERRPELFVPSSSGRIIPQVPTAPKAQASEPPAPIIVNQNYYGPTTGRGRLSEIEWSLRYATRARGYEGAVA